MDWVLKSVLQHTPRLQGSRIPQDDLASQQSAEPPLPEIWKDWLLRCLLLHTPRLQERRITKDD